MMENQVLTPQQEAKKRYDALVDQIRSMDAKGLVAYLQPQHRSDVYMIIRDIITPRQLKEINSDLKLKKEFGVLKQEANKSWEHDHKSAMMKDVDGACTAVYSTVLKLMKASNDDTASAIIKIQEAINRIESHLAIEQTKWIEINQDSDVEQHTTPTSEDDKDASHEDEQGIS